MKAWLFLLVFALPICAQNRFAVFGDPADRNVKAYQAAFSSVSLPHGMAQDAEGESGLMGEAHGN